MRVRFALRVVHKGLWNIEEETLTVGMVGGWLESFIGV